MGSLASTWCGWLVRDGSGGSFFQWVRLLLSTANRVLTEVGSRQLGYSLSSLPSPAQPSQASQSQARGQGESISADHKLASGAPSLTSAPLGVSEGKQPTWTSSEALEALVGSLPGCT